MHPCTFITLRTVLVAMVCWLNIFNYLQIVYSHVAILATVCELMSHVLNYHLFNAVNLEVVITMLIANTRLCIQ